MTAEFKISRLKYTWRSQWQIGTVYNSDDVISVGGKVYACLERHTASSNFYNDLEFVNTDTPPLPVPKWSLVADGVSFRNNWSTNTYYLVGDIVRHGGTLYINLEQHTSQSSQDNFNIDRITNSYWGVLLTSNDWLDVWTVNTLYKLGDVVRYNGIVYECIENHRSTPTVTAGLIADEVKWVEVVEGLEWKSSWLVNTLYLKNDVVKYGGIVYRCTIQHTSAVTIQLGLEDDEEKWTVVHSGVEFLGVWATNTRYKLNDVVQYGNFVYQCTTPHFVSIVDTFNPSNWSIFCPGQEYKTVWNSSAIYTPGDIVRHGGYLFVSDSFNSNSRPEYEQESSNSNWSLLFKGTKIRGEYSSTQTYLTGDLVKRKGQLYVAKTNIPAGQDTDVIGDGSSINEPYWDLFIPGVQWTAGWLERQTYVIGDLAFWRGRTYKCVIKHISNFDNRPDQNIENTWEPYTYGNSDNVLSFVGDLKYFGIKEDGSSIGSTNLIIGSDSQTLVSSESTPTWSNFNFSNSVYYVSPTGKDGETRGITLNAAWRTLRYALENVTGPATVFLKSGTYEEILPLIIPPNVAVVGEELRGVIIKPVENFYTQLDIDRYENFLNYLQTIVPLIVQEHVIGTDNISSPAFGTTLYSNSVQVISGSPATTVQANTTLSLLNTISDYATVNAGTGLSGTNERVEITSNSEKAASIILNNRNFIAAEVKAWLTNVYPSYDYNDNQITVDVIRVLNALAYDLRYPGTYKSVQTGKLFYFGSSAFDNKISNMFLLRDGTGIRNCTLIGLEGELTPLNSNLTRRTTAGAYASLDPGYGPNDTSVHVGNRSPYVQNVTTFGTGCIGLKVDGTLHAGGNKTIVANDFTQILSDGIGVWCNASGGSEVVSIFTYYNHIGYLCTEGGKIRGTNGNCSYGQYGAVAEGFDGSEIPITATVNNRFFDATVSETFSSNGEIIRLFFNHAGQDYTSATFTTTGSGTNAEYVADEFRSRSIAEARLVDPGDSSAPGGSGYTLNINNAQAGDLYTITIASSDEATPAEYQDLRIVLQTGTGSGQFGYIADYNDTSKIIYVAKEYYDTLTATETAATGNLITLNTTDNLYIDDAVLFTGTTIGGVSTETVYYITSIVGDDITISLSVGGANEVLSNAVGSMTLHKAGWESFQGGRTIEPTLDTTTSYYIEPRIQISKPPTGNTTVNLGLSSSWKAIASLNGTSVILATNVPNGTNIVRYSTNNTTWDSGTSLPTAVWTSVAAGDGKFVAVSFSATAAISTNGATWSEITLPTGQYNSVAYGNGRWVAVGYGTSSAKSADGSTWTSSTLPEGAEWSSVAYGKGKFVAVAASDSTTTNTAYTIDNGDSWTLGSFAGGCKSIAYGNNRFVAIAGGYVGANDCFISFDGISWTPANIPAANWQSIAYGEGLFVAVANGENFVITSQDGVNWTKQEIASADTYTTVGFSKKAGVGKFYIAASGSINLVELSAGARALARISLNSNRISTIKFWETGSGYTNTPTATVYDPNNSFNAVIDLRLFDGVLGNPTILNSGAGYVSLSSDTSISGDGFKDEFQTGRFLIVDGADRIPGPGDNLNIQGINDYTYKTLGAEVLSGTTGNYRLRLTVAKNLNASESPDHDTIVTIRQKYSQVRLTGHDFLDIGLGNFEQTNYPTTLFPNGTVLAPEDETKESSGGRVFYTSTDQDGNFRVGELFAVEQASGTVTISADFFQLEGLEEIAIGGVSVGGSGVVVREFSTDPFFIADSNNIIPTQRAIKEYLARRVSGGGSDAFTGQFTAGIIRVGPRSITTTTGERIDIPVAVRFNRPVSGVMLAHSLFMAGPGDGMQES